MRTYCIYRIKHRTSAKVYIGQTFNFKKRVAQHKGLREKTYITKALRKHGVDCFVFDIIEKGLTSEQVDERERYWIKWHDSTNKKYGYNIESGGNKNKTLSDETCKKISKRKTGSKASLRTKIRMSESRRGENNNFYGKTHSQETREHLSKVHKGSKHSEYTKYKISKGASESLLGMPQLAFYIRIKLLFRAGWTIRRIARVFKHSRHTIRKYRDLKDADISL